MLVRAALFVHSRPGMDGVFRVIAEQRNSETVKTFRHWCVCVCSEVYAVFLGPNFPETHGSWTNLSFSLFPSLFPRQMCTKKNLKTHAHSPKA